MREPRDDEIRRLFEEARRNDEAKAPAFRRVLDRDASRRHAPRWIGRALAAAAAVIVLTLAVRLLRPTPEAPTVRIEEWKPATDVLLEASFTDLFDVTPVLPEPVPDYAPLLAKQKEKGTKS
jgi:hypothetical protein